MILNSRSIYLALFALLVMNQAVSGKTYSVAIEFALADGNDDCVGDDAVHVDFVADEALRLAGMNLAGSSDNWKVITEHGHQGAYNGNGKGRALIETEERNLGGCDKWCQFMCKSQGTYCVCCSCCGSRRLRRQLKVTEGTDLLEIERNAAKYALTLLNDGSHASCLKVPYEVNVIMEQDVL